MLEGLTRPLRAYVLAHMAAVCAALAGIAFLATFVRWMRLWHGVPNWHQWFDQGEYLKSATALAVGDLSPTLHHYPPLYPLLAAPFTWLSPNEPFFVVNLIVLMATVGMLVRMFASVIGSPIVTGLFALGFLAHPAVLFETTVIPWTSTPTTFLVVAALYCLMKIEQGHDVYQQYSLLFGLSLGLLVPTRPLDAMIALFLVPFWMLSTWRATASSHGRTRLQAFAVRSVGTGLVAMIGPAILIGFNLVVFGRPLSPYITGNSQGFYWGNLPDKFVSLVLDSATLFVQPAQTLLQRFPWVPLGLGVIIVCLRYGPIWLRAAATVVALQFLVNLAFVELVPNGLYTYHNYHYFRWALWLDFLMLPTACVLLHRRFQSRAWKPAAVLVLGTTALACLQLRPDEAAISIVRSDSHIAIDLPPTRRIGYVDVAGLSVDWQKTYFSDPQAQIDGRRMRFNREIWALPTTTGTRFVFLKAMTGGHLELPTDGWTLGSPLLAVTGSTSLTMGVPRSLGRQSNRLPVGVAQRLDGAMSNSLFASGFSNGPDRRVISGREATLNLSLGPRSTPYRLRLSMIARDPISVEFYVSKSGTPALIAEVDLQLREIELSIPSTVLSTWRSTSVLIRPQRSTGTISDARLAITALRVD